MSETGNAQRILDPLFEQIVEQTPDALIFADREGAIRLWNKAAEKAFGHTAAEVIGGSLDVIIPERFRDAHWAGFRRAIDSGSTKYAGRALTTRAVHKDGRALYVDLTFSLVKDAQGRIKGALASARDCTEKHLSQRAAQSRVANTGEARS